MMGAIEVHAGDFKPGKDGQLAGNWLYLKRPKKMFREKIRTSELDEVEVATEESVKKLAGTLGWGAVGAVVLGPVGLLAGLLVGGRKTKVSFVATLKDGRRFLGTTDSKTYTRLAAAAFKSRPAA